MSSEIGHTCLNSKHACDITHAISAQFNKKKKKTKTKSKPSVETNSHDTHFSLNSDIGHFGVLIYILEKNITSYIRGLHVDEDVVICKNVDITF
jgi:hypothetical protein